MFFNSSDPVGNRIGEFILVSLGTVPLNCLSILALAFIVFELEKPDDFKLLTKLSKSLKEQLLKELSGVG